MGAIELNLELDRWTVEEVNMKFDFLKLKIHKEKNSSVFLLNFFLNLHIAVLK